MPLKQFTVSGLNTDIASRDGIYRLAERGDANDQGLTFEEWACAVCCDMQFDRSNTAYNSMLLKLRYGGELYKRSEQLFGMASEAVRKILLHEWYEGVDPSELRVKFSKINSEVA
jgi:hypothetical protein